MPSKTIPESREAGSLSRLRYSWLRAVNICSLQKITHSQSSAHRRARIFALPIFGLFPRRAGTNDSQTDRLPIFKFQTDQRSMNYVSHDFTVECFPTFDKSQHYQRIDFILRELEFGNQRDFITAGHPHDADERCAGVRGFFFGGLDHCIHEFRIKLSGDDADSFGGHICSLLTRPIVSPEKFLFQVARLWGIHLHGRTPAELIHPGKPTSNGRGIYHFATTRTTNEPGLTLRCGRPPGVAGGVSRYSAALRKIFFVCGSKAMVLALGCVFTAPASSY